MVTRTRAGKSEPSLVTLADRTLLLLRPLRVSDRADLRDGFHRLSIASRHSRFLHYVPRLSESELAYLTDVDQVDHAAIAAFELSPRGKLGVGVARYVRLEDERDVAEAALTVVDSHQGRGVGSALIDRLSEIAIENGVTRFRAHFLPENVAIRRLIGAAHQSARLGRDGLMHVDVPLVAPRGRPRPRFIDQLRALLSGFSRGEGNSRSRFGILSPRRSPAFATHALRTSA